MLIFYDIYKKFSLPNNDKMSMPSTHAMQLSLREELNLSFFL